MMKDSPRYLAGYFFFPSEIFSSFLFLLPSWINSFYLLISASKGEQKTFASIYPVIFLPLSLRSILQHPAIAVAFSFVRLCLSGS